MEARLANLEAEVAALKRSVKQLRHTTARNSEFIDCVGSALWKRVRWWFMGFYFRKVGRWYGPGKGDTYPVK